MNDRDWASLQGALSSTWPTEGLGSEDAAEFRRVVGSCSPDSVKRAIAAFGRKDGQHRPKPPALFALAHALDTANHPKPAETPKSAGGTTFTTIALVLSILAAPIGLVMGLVSLPRTLPDSLARRLAINAIVFGTILSIWWAISIGAVLSGAFDEELDRDDAEVALEDLLEREGESIRSVSCYGNGPLYWCTAVPVLGDAERYFVTEDDGGFLVEERS